MTAFDGYRLPEELVALREQVRRFVRDEIIPVEQRIDPDAAELPDEDHRRLVAKTKAAGLWCLGAPASTAWASTTPGVASSGATRRP